jgi:hypothetical protein
MTNHTAETSALFYARVAGFAYVLTVILGAINVFFISPNLFVWGNDAETAKNILANEGLFRTYIAIDLAMFAGVVLAYVGLYITLKTVNRNLALLALLWRIGESGLGAVTVLSGIVALLLLKGTGSLTVFGPDQLHALAGLALGVRGAGYDILMVFMGLGATLFCYLFLKSQYIPRILAIWGIFTYVSMIIYGFVKILDPNPHPDLWLIMMPGALFELTLGLWLLFKGITTQRT